MGFVHNAPNASATIAEDDGPFVTVHKRMDGIRPTLRIDCDAVQLSSACPTMKLTAEGVM